MCPLLQTRAEFVLERVITARFKSGVERNASRTGGDESAPNLRLHIDAMLRLHSNRKIVPELARERIERSERTRREHDGASAIFSGEFRKTPTQDWSRKSSP